MRSSTLLACLLAGTALSAGTSAQTLTDEQLLNAIRAGERGEKLSKESDAERRGLSRFGRITWGNTGPSLGRYRVFIEGPIGRVMRLARVAVRNNESISPQDIDDDVLAPVITVSVIPVVREHATPDLPPDTIRLETRPPKDAERISLHALSVRPSARWWRLERSYGDGTVAAFDFDTVMGLPHKDVDVVVSIGDEERACKVSRKERLRLR